MNRIKTGFISYSNCFPVYYPFTIGAFNHPEIKIFAGKPSKLNRLLARQALDISSVSSIEYASLADNYLILNGISLNSYGYVKSVLLISRCKIEDLDERKIGLTAASATSHALLKIIMADHYKSTPRYTISDKFTPGMDALLLIGDDALNYEASKSGEATTVSRPFGGSGSGAKTDEASHGDKLTGKLHVYDLGQLWARIYRKPVIFALWLVHRKYSKNRDRIMPLITSMKKSCQYTRSHWDEFMAAAGKRYAGLGIDLEEYYSKLSFDFDREKKDALLFFLEKAHRQNLCPECRSLKFF